MLRKIFYLVSRYLNAHRYRFLVFEVFPNTQAHYNEAVNLLNFGTPKNNEFSIWDKWKIYYSRLVGWLFWVKRPFETVFQSISGRLPKRGRKRRERIDKSKNVQTTPTRNLLQVL